MCYHDKEVIYHRGKIKPITITVLKTKTSRENKDILALKGSERKRDTVFEQFPTEG